MFSSLARSRALALSLFLSTCAYAAEDILFTSSVTYCNPPETLLIQRFEIAYFPSNNSVSFNVSAASVQSNVNVTANLFVNVYGMQPINMTLDLCGILGGALCPLPMYNFTGADSITLPSSINVAKSVPGIAYVIPDLEGFAQLSLNEIKTGDLKACVQATLSNGRSAHQPAVEWTTGGVTIAALLVVIWQSVLSPQALLPFRLLELMTLYQTIASSAFLDLNYPSVYRAFTINFSWALGLISASSVQNSINRMRHLTGGNLEDAIGGSAVGLVNRKLSPYNQPLSSAYVNGIGYGSILSRALPTNLAAVIHPNLATYFSPSVRQTIVDGNVQTVTAASPNVLQAGVPIYVNTLHIATANAFMTVFLCTLCIIAVALATFALGYGVIALAKRIDGRKRTKISSTVANFDYQSFVISWCLRTGLVVFFPLLIFIFYQWSLKDSWLSILLSVISFLAIMALIGYPLFRVIRTARGESYALYEHKSEFLLRNGPLYAQHRPERHYFSALLIGAFFLRAVFIAAAQSSGEAQLALFIITELALVVAHIWLKPAATRGGDVLGSYLAILRLACTGLMIAFLERLAVKAIPRVVIGIVIAIAWSVAVLIVLGSIAWQTVAAVIRNVRGLRPSASDSPARLEGSMLEKGTRGMPMGNGNGSTRSNLMGTRASVHSASAESERSSMRGTDAASSLAAVACARPVNPTPEDNDRAPLDAYALYAAYPISPTGTTVSTAEPPSLYSRDSGTLTVGSLLPRRWSFGLSQPGSPAASSDEQHRRSSLTPPSPSEASSYASGGISRTASARAPVHHPTNPDIEEEEVLPPSLSPRPPPS